MQTVVRRALERERRQWQTEQGHLESTCAALELEREQWKARCTALETRVDRLEMDRNMWESRCSATEKRCEATEARCAATEAGVTALLEQQSRLLAQRPAYADGGGARGGGTPSLPMPPAYPGGGATPAWDPRLVGWDPDPSSLWCTQSLEGHTGGVRALCVSGDRLFSAGNDKRVIMWNTKTMKHMAIFKGHTKGVWALCVTCNKLFSGSIDKTIRVWDIAKGAHLATMEGHTYGVRALAVSGAKLFSGSEDRTIKMWDALSHSHLGDFLGHEGGVLTLNLTLTLTLTLTLIGSRRWSLESLSFRDEALLWQHRPQHQSVEHRDTAAFGHLAGPRGRYQVARLLWGQAVQWRMRCRDPRMGHSLTRSLKSAHGTQTKRREPHGFWQQTLFRERRHHGSCLGCRDARVHRRASGSKWRCLRIGVGK